MKGVLHEQRRIDYEPGFITRLNMHPRDVDRLTLEEFERCCGYIDELVRMDGEAARQ